MYASVLSLMLSLLPAGQEQPRHWELPIVSRNGDTMYTDLAGIERVAPHVYRAWSRYAYPAGSGGEVEALVQKEYDCLQRRRRILSAAFYDSGHRETWRSQAPGAWIPVTGKGVRQWAAVCHRVEGSVDRASRLAELLRRLAALPARAVSWLKRSLL